MTDYSGADLETGIHNALAAGNMRAVADFLKAMAVVDPPRAQDMLNVIEVGLSLRDSYDMVTMLGLAPR